MRRTVLALTALGMLAGCATPQPTTFAGLVAKYQAIKRIDCTRAGLGGFRVDPDCVVDREKRRVAIGNALYDVHVADVERAPACVTRYRVSPDVLKAAGLNPKARNPAAELVTRGFILGALKNDSECAAEVCRWRNPENNLIAPEFCS